MKPMLLAWLMGFMAVSAFAAGSGSTKGFTDSFEIDKTELTSTGRNRFFVLEPGYQLVLEGKEKGKVAVCLWTAPLNHQHVGFVRSPVGVKPPFNPWTHSQMDARWHYFGED
jgi:hypothetical protein